MFESFVSFYTSKIFFSSQLRKGADHPLFPVDLTLSVQTTAGTHFAFANPDTLEMDFCAWVRLCANCVLSKTTLCRNQSFILFLKKEL